jgi:hypothetical protein
MTGTRSANDRQAGLPMPADGEPVGDPDGHSRPAPALPVQRLSHKRTTATAVIPAVALANPRRVRLIDLRDASEVS